MKTRMLFFFLFVFFLIETISGQESVDTTNRTKFKHALGVGVGGTIGYGLSYRFMPGKFGIQTTFAPYNDNYKTQISFGVTFLYRLIETEKTNLFIYEGNQYFYENYTNTIYADGKKDGVFNNGIGIGVEIIIIKRISFNLMGGYAGYENFNRIGFTGETSLFFRF